MPAIVVTRLRLRDPALLDEFFTDAAIEHAMKSEGNRGTDALADANNAWWSVTASQSATWIVSPWSAALAFSRVSMPGAKSAAVTSYPWTAGESD